jgi:hypothetical protein
MLTCSGFWQRRTLTLPAPLSELINSGPREIEPLNAMKLRFYDWVFFLVLVAVAVSGGTMIILLAAIVGLLYLIVRLYVTKSRTVPTATALSEEDDEFVVSDSQNQSGTNYTAGITTDVDINHRQAPGHFRLESQFDLESGKAEYEYKLDGTSVFIRLLTSYDWGESTHFTDEWEVRDGVVLESDMRARWEAREFKWGSIDEKIADLKKQTEWTALAPWSFNGFVYYLLNRALPAPDSRRYLRQEIERLKVGNAKAIQESAKYGIEPDPNPESVDGWRWIGGHKPEGANVDPFWETVKSGAYGVAREEVGKVGTTQIAFLHKLLGDVVRCSKCDRSCLNTDRFCTGCGTRL